MTGPFNIPSEYQWDETNGLRGCGECATFRLSQRRDGKSVLLHEIDSSISPKIHDAVFASQPPKFTEPFVTNFSGIFERRDRTYLVESLPPSVPLLDTWQTVLQNAPDQAGNMLCQLITQLKHLLQSLTDRGERHGAVCAKNVFLTTEQTYGLLAARLETTQGEEVWLRPSELVSRPNPADDLFVSTEYPESIALVLQDLLTVKTQLGALSIQERSELQQQSELHIGTLQVL